MAAPEYPVFPTRERPLQPYEAVVEATPVTRRAIAAGRARRRRPRHPHARAGAGGRARGSARRDARSPTPTRARPPGLAPYAIGARPPRTRGRPRAVERDGAARRARAAPGPGRAQRDAAPARAAAASTACTAASASGLHRRHVPAARVPARVAGARARRRAAAVGAAVRPGASRRRATIRWCWSRPRPRRIPSTGCCAPALTGLAREPVRVLATYEPPAAPGTAARARERAAGRLALVLADDARAARWSICHAGHGTLARALARGAPWSRCRTRATWPRTPPAPTGPASACGCRGGCCRRRRCGSRCGERCRDPRLRRARSELAAWAPRTTAPARGRAGRGAGAEA